MTHRHIELAGRKILVTGASGFLGTHLCRELLDVQATVHAVSRSPHRTDHENLHWWRGDVADLSTTRDLLSIIRPDVIFHLAGCATAAPDPKLVLPTFNSLLVSTVNILTAAYAVGSPRIVLTGSLTEPQAGGADPIPSSPYGAAKWASSAYGRMFHALYGAPVVVLRLFMSYGPNQDSSKLIPYVTLSFLRGEAPRLSSGAWRADWVYVDDVIDALLAAGHVRGVEGSTIDIGSGTLVTIRAIVDRLTCLTASSVEALYRALPDRPREEVRSADTADAHAKLGWKPVTSLADGLARTVEWYRRELAEAVTSLASIGPLNRKENPQ